MHTILEDQPILGAAAWPADADEHADALDKEMAVADALSKEMAVAIALSKEMADAVGRVIALSKEMADAVGRVIALGKELAVADALADVAAREIK